jgi:tetratricopeptide (TPR) repeat protein
MNSDHPEPADDGAQLRELFHAACEMAETDRASFLDRSCAGKPELRIKLEKLLGADSAAESEIRWQTPALDIEVREMAADVSLPFEKLGPYHIVSRIGSGGMGAVYLAWRDYDEVRRNVAIKIVPRALLDDNTILRFRQERQILARLEHPHIARMLDAGRTPDGMPYLVMEFVEGIPLDRYAASAGLSAAAVVKLFQSICDAVGYAHRNLVVHRDLKPGNILVTADGVPKLLDFGIARLLSETSNPDATAAAMMTPRYASPEQLSGEHITTASDIYSLGVVLQELLSGRPRSADMETVIAKALQREPERRYASAADFGEDMRRAVDGYPVRARPDSLLYRGRRFVSRRKWETAVVSAMAVALAVSSVVAWEQYRSAQQRFSEVRGIANSFLFEVYDALAGVPGTTEARMIVARRAQQFLDVLARDRSSDLSLRRELATSHHRLGNILGTPFLANMGDASGALSNYQKAAALLEGVDASHKADASVLTELATLYRLQGQIFIRRGSPGEAVAAGERSATFSARAEASQASSRQARYALSNDRLFLSLAQLELGRARDDIGPLRRSEALATAARDAARELVGEDPANERYQTLFERACEYLAYAELDIAPRSTEADYAGRAVGHHREQLEIVKGLFVRKPDLYGRNLADSFADLSRAWLAVGQPKESEKSARESVRGFEQIAASDPRNIEAVRDVMVARWGLARALDAQQRDGEAAVEFERLLAGYEQVHRQDPADKGYTMMAIVTEARDRLGAYRMSKGMPAAAIALYRRNIQDLEASDVVSEMAAVALDYGRIGDATAATPAQSKESYRRAAVIWEKLRDSRRLPTAFQSRPAELRRRASAP